MTDTVTDHVRSVYATTRRRLATVRDRIQRPLTYAEKLLYGHLADPAGQELAAGSSYLRLHPDRIALQDATAQMAILQFILANRDSSTVPVTVHCDHLIRAETDARHDLRQAEHDNREVYEFLASASARYGFRFWKPGAGIIHQVVLEQYAFPGLLMIGTDSHTPNAGGLGAFASGVGGADAVDVMVGQPWEVLHPRTVGVKLTGELNGWTTPKDVILKLLDVLTVSGGTNRVIEYFGPGAASISCTGKATICNMGAELGATTSVFPFDARMLTYLRATGQHAIADLAAANSDLLQADEAITDDPEQHYDRVVDIDLSTLPPYVVGAHRPDCATPASAMAEHLRKGGWPAQLTHALIGSCTNSSYEDMMRVADIARQAIEHGIQPRVPLWITPGSEQVRATLERDGVLELLRELGARVLANACGPCIGQWLRHDIESGEVNSIVSSYNRNFPRRNDGNAATCSFLASPDTALLYSFHGRLDRDPFTTPIETPTGAMITFTPPGTVAETPAGGYVRDETGCIEPPDDGRQTVVAIGKDSDRLQPLVPFPAWDGNDLTGLLVLLKAAGACTTDHISPAGQWLRFRGHLENISDNAFAGAVNAFADEAGTGTDVLRGESGVALSEIAKRYKAGRSGWVAIGDSNYGEGSSREHAAMSPRYLGCRAVIARSFARIHETNLKKQGVLPLTFADAEDYGRILQDDRLDITGLSQLAPGQAVRAVIRHSNGDMDEIELNHTLNAEQIGWFHAGSALNALNKRESD